MSFNQFELLKQISAKPENKIVGIVRNKALTDKRVKEDLGGVTNITILEADLTNYDQVKVRSDIVSHQTP